MVGVAWEVRTDAILGSTQVAELSGGHFVARRMMTDAWPILKRMLETGETDGNHEVLNFRPLYHEMPA